MIKIIDISAHVISDKMDYDKVASEVNGVILRGSYGSQPEKEFENHYQGFHGKLPIGIYHYLVEYDSPLEQLNRFKSYVLGKEFQLGYWADIELEKGAPELTAGTVNEYIRIAELELGVKYGFYSSRTYWDRIMRTDRYKDRKFWVANWGVSHPAMPVTGGWENWWLWQDTTNYILQGYNHFWNGKRVGVDASNFWGGAEDYNTWVGDEVVVPEPAPGTPMYQVEVVTHALNVRSQPFVGDNKVGGVYDGDILNVFAESNGWLNIGWGWCSGAYTRRIEVPDPPPSTIETRVTALEEGQKELENRVSKLESK